jgi:uncharacterized protein YbjT (DUF2867 family)
VRVLLYGASGMIGQGVLRQCLIDLDVDEVVAIGRASTGVQYSKLREVIAPDLVAATETEVTGAAFDACFFCLGVSAARLSEAEYSRITYDLTLSIASILSRTNPQMTFIYVSGAGTDSSERGSVMWARVKGRTENVLRRLPFKAVFLFRPGIIQPVNGERSRTTLYRVVYTVLAPIAPLLQRLFPRQILTTESIADAMLNAVRHGAPKAVLEVADIQLLSSSVTPRG